MAETFYSLNQLNTTAAFFAALVLGVAFGFVLERAGFGSARRIAGVFYFTDMTVVKVMFAATLTAMLGLVALAGVGWLPTSQLHLLRGVYGAQAVGGLLFGVGFAMSGWCPGTGAVGVASGKLDALVFLLGIAIGAFAFNETYHWLTPLYNWGAQTEAHFAFGLPTTLFALAFCLAGVTAFYGSEWIEGRTTGTGRYFNAQSLKGLSVALVGAAAVLLILPMNLIGNASNSIATAIPWRVEKQVLAEIETGTDHIEPEMLANRLLQGDAGLLVIDIRPLQEYQRFHLRGAINATLSDLPTTLESYPEVETIVLYSNGMTHPAQARDVLAMRGYRNIYLLTDGLQGFLDRCLRPISVRDEPLPAAAASQVQRWREFFLATTLAEESEKISMDQNL